MKSTVELQITPALFPIQGCWPERDYPPQLRQIPWALMQKHEAQALRNHCGQSLARLAERGGLDAMEAVAVLDDKEYYERWGYTGETRTKQLEAIRILRARVEAPSDPSGLKRSDATGASSKKEDL